MKASRCKDGALALGYCAKKNKNSELFPAALNSPKRLKRQLWAGAPVRSCRTDSQATAGSISMFFFLFWLPVLCLLFVFFFSFVITAGSEIALLKPAHPESSRGSNGLVLRTFNVPVSLRERAARVSAIK